MRDCGRSCRSESDLSVAVLTPAANGLTPVVTILTPPLVQCDHITRKITNLYNPLAHTLSFPGNIFQNGSYGGIPL